MPENLPREKWKEDLSDHLSGLVEYFRRLDAQIQVYLDTEAGLSAESRERLADIQERLRSPQGYFSESANFVRRWL